MVSTNNKIVTGEFKYRLFLPQASFDHNEEFEKLNLLTLKPIKIHPFADDCRFYYAYAPVGDDKALLLSASQSQPNQLQADLIQTKGKRKLIQ